MKKVIVLLTLVPVFAADPAGFVIWKAHDLADFDKKLGPKMNDKKVATEQLSNFGNHSTMVAHREGEAEVHDKMADLFVCQSGTATLIIGGTVPGGKVTATGETRGPSVQGGERKTLGPGDIVHIPAGVPHQLLVAKGTKFNYFVMKVESK
jgi:mannose-6-phosphate isomerase-like protein (cupin superfamily)